jgi:hypothetical protein
MNAVDILKYGQQTVLQTLEGFPGAAVETPGACGVWSVKDIIAHLASYEQVLVDVLSTFIGRHPTPSLDKFTEPGGQFNDNEVGRRKGRTMREVLGEFNGAHAQVMELAAQISPELFCQTGPCPGMAWTTPWMISLSIPSMDINASIALKSPPFMTC